MKKPKHYAVNGIDLRGVIRLIPWFDIIEDDALRYFQKEFIEGTRISQVRSMLADSFERGYHTQSEHDLSLHHGYDFGNIVVNNGKTLTWNLNGRCTEYVRIARVDDDLNPIEMLLEIKE